MWSPPLADGILMGYEFEEEETRNGLKVGYILSFAKANVPAQLYLYAANNSSEVPEVLSKERVLGIEQKFLSQGEDASYCQ